jgi:hypothetical protein
MDDYSEFPPIKSFIRVLKTCPRSAFLYTKIWEKADRRLHVIIRKKDIRKDYLISQTIFRNLLAPLAFLNLLHYCEGDDKFDITVSGPQVNE